MSSRRRPSGSKDKVLPVLPLTGGVLLPGHSLVLAGFDFLSPIDQRRARAGRLAVVVLPQIDDAHSAVGVEAIVSGLQVLATGETGGEVTGLRRVEVAKLTRRAGVNYANVRAVAEPAQRANLAADAMFRALKVASVRVVRDDDARRRLAAIDDPSLLCDLLASHLTLGIEEKLALLRESKLSVRMQSVLAAASREERLLEVSDRVRKQVDRRLKEAERRDYLREQLRVLKRELGEAPDGQASMSEIEALASDLEARDLPAEVREVVDRELARLAMTSPLAPEYMVGYTLLSWLRDLPWAEHEQRVPTIAEARKILAQSHHGLLPIKERVLEYLAVMQRQKKVGGELLLLVGPPGVGKTTLAKQIAAALGRPFTKVALGGVKDESEIRGHRRTYVGALPGKILQAMRTVGTTAPVILLDEIDKIGLDNGRGSVASALLEVLDYGQNHAFTDHYLSVPYDLSKVVFIATANSAAPLPRPLLDRMEVVELPSYTEVEKLQIAKHHLLPSARKVLGLSSLRLSDAAVLEIVRKYTREAGVRQLNRCLLTIGRKSVLAEMEGRKSEAFSEANLPKYLGPVRFPDEPNEGRLVPGVALGLAYTSVGGDLLYVETSLSAVADGKGRLTVTGSLGKVMKESAQAAWAYLSGRSSRLSGVDPQAYATSHVHLHLPGGAIPKDGPSAGLAIVAAIASQLTGKPLPAKLAMTGEISLRGQVLAVGGIKEKLLAAHRYGKRQVLIPASNKADLEQLPREVLRELEIKMVSTIDEALELLGLVGPKVASRVERPRRVGARAVQTNPIGRVYDLR